MPTFQRNERSKQIRDITFYKVPLFWGFLLCLKEVIAIIKTLDLQRNTTSILENAFSIGYTKVSNQIWSASFSLPINDPKVKKVQLLKYVEIDDVGLFRIIPKQTSKSSNSVSFQCEHVLATLLNTMLFKYHQLTNYTTRDSLQYLLDQQREKHWKLGTVEFTRYFHYSWENDNLLSAIFSIPKPFDEQYRWTWDTSTYPWTLNLVKPETEPTGRIKEGHNLVNFEIEENPLSVINRIYPLGAGEGVNQLGIESVNNGIPYIEDAESIAENGVFETVWPDKRFEDAASLKANAEALLKEWKEPIVSWSVSAADVSEITGAKIDELKEGKIIRLELDNYPVTDLRIMKETKSDIKGKPWDVQLEIGSLTEDLSTTQADLERRQKVNELYSQGATNIDSHDYNDNCDPNNSAVIRFFLPDDLVNVNELKLYYEIENFRAYSQATKGGGSTVKSTSSGGGTSTSTKSGGGSSQTSSSGGGTNVTSSFKADYNYYTGPDSPTNDPDNPGSHHHAVYNPGHAHTVSISNHSHSVPIPAHTHDFEVPNHTHDITLPDHTHEIQHGIFRLTDLPTSVVVKVDNNVVPVNATSGENINLIPYLSKDSSGRIERGKWHEVTITPNKLGRVNANIISRLFIQSRMGGIY